MTRPLTITAIVALMALSGVVAGAQDAPEEEVANGRIDFVLGENIYELDPSVAVNGCIEGLDETLTDERATLRLFGRVTGPQLFEPLGVFETALTADLGQHPVGYCIAFRGD